MEIALPISHHEIYGNTKFSYKYIKSEWNTFLKYFYINYFFPIAPMSVQRHNGHINKYIYVLFVLYTLLLSPNKFKFQKNNSNLMEYFAIELSKTL